MSKGKNMLDIEEKVAFTVLRAVLGVVYMAVIYWLLLGT